MSDAKKSLLKVNNLSVSFDTTEGSFDAVKSINLDLKKGETLAIIGESGSGKSVTASVIMGILTCPPGRIKSGEVFLNDLDILKLSDTDRRKLMGSKVAIIFQGITRDVFINPNHAYTRQLMNSIPGKITKQKKKVLKKFSDPILEIKNISKFYDTVACDDVSFNLFPNEVLGIVGESGSGKTTISNLILRLASPSNGKILYLSLIHI